MGHGCCVHQLLGDVVAMQSYYKCAAKSIWVMADVVNCYTLGRSLRGGKVIVLCFCSDEPIM